MHRFSQLALIISIVLLGLNLRPALASISPLIDQIRGFSGMSDEQISLLTSIPVFLMGAIAFYFGTAKWVLPVRSGCFLAMTILGIACLSRWFSSDSTSLLLTAVGAGVGIALVQVILPGVVKTYFDDKVGFVMGLYTTAIVAGAAFASGLSPLLAEYQNTQIALALWGVPALIAALLWIVANPSEDPAIASTASTASTKPASVQSKSFAIIWRLCLLFGICAGGYTLVMAWLPDYYQTLGWTEVGSGGLLSLLTGIEIIAGLLISLCIGKLPNPKFALLGATSLLGIGLILLILWPNSMVWLCMFCLGMGIGALFPLSFIVAMEQCNNGAEAQSLTATVQGVGYMLASIFPYVAGLVKSEFSSMISVWGGMLALCLGLVYLSFYFYPSNWQKCSVSVG